MSDASIRRTATCAYPLRVAPIFVERVWGVPVGSEALAALYPAGEAPVGQASKPATFPLPERTAPERIGEVWLTGSANQIASGPHAGSRLQELTSAWGPALLGQAGSPPHPSGAPVFPLLVKFLFTADKLSVQVHPHDAYAQEHERSWGKTEMWHILRAEPGARLAIGFRQGAPPPEVLREAAASGAIEQMLQWMEARTGDTFFVPAGAIHAIGGGLVLCEIQQNSDVTYRLFDYHRLGADGRARPLHLEQGLAVLDGSVHCGRTHPLPWHRPEGSCSLLAACPYFATERWELREPLTVTPGGRCEIWVGLQGAAEMKAGGERVICQAGEAVIVPAGAPSCHIQPQGPSVFLRVYRPDLQKDVLAPLRAAGNRPEELSKVCFPMTVESSAEETAL